MHILFHGRYNSMDKQVIGVYSSIETAKNKAAFIAMEDEASGIGHYAEGPGISYPADSGILFRGLRENPYCLWVQEFEVDK
jgi:hypothetical protein